MSVPFLLSSRNEKSFAFPPMRITKRVINVTDTDDSRARSASAGAAALSVMSLMSFSSEKFRDFSNRFGLDWKFFAV